MTGMQDEMELLTPAQRAAVQRVIVLVRADGKEHRETLSELEEAYAYPGAGVIHWGFNGGERGGCVARGLAVL
jgi:hypothetical protein